MAMKIIPVNTLTGSALDWGVAQCEMMRENYRDRGLLVHRIGYGQPMPEYSTNWSQGGPIIEREKINIGISTIDEWMAFIYDGSDMIWIVHGQTPLVTAMRCYVASKFGDTVKIPNDLL